MEPLLVREQRAKVIRRIRVNWDPKPVPAPELAPDLASMPAMNRTAEILRYRLLRLEHAVSPNGALRAWLRLNVRLALIIAIPTLLLGPILLLVLAGLADMTASLAEICLNLLEAVLAIVAIIAVIAALVAVFGG